MTYLAHSNDFSPQIVNKGTIPPLPAKEEFFNGKVVRPLRSVNPDQDEYCGLIQEEGVGELMSHSTFISNFESLAVMKLQ